MEKGVTEKTLRQREDGDAPSSLLCAGNVPKAGEPEEAAGTLTMRRRPRRELPETAELETVEPEEAPFAISGFFSLEKKSADPASYSPLALAFLGDAVYSLVIRTSVLAKGNRQAEKLHNETSRLVRAQKQAAIGRAVYDLLTQREQKIYRRGRNSHPMHRARSASPEEYFHATALEALCGFLYLEGRMDRVLEILGKGMELTSRRNGEPLL